MREAHGSLRDEASKLTDEQRGIAAFWDCNPYVMHVQGHTMFATKKVTPGGHWMGIVAHRGAEGRCRRDAVGGSVRAHRHRPRRRLHRRVGREIPKRVIRPETVINKYLDEGWEPLLQTPPFPEYTSGHSVISTAAAVVLTDQFGPNFAFVDSTEAEFGLPVRSFTSFEQAAAEAAISRLYGGIHYRRAIEQGVIQGRQVGQNVVARVRTRAAQVAAAKSGAPGN